jgi:hypothetical protein
LRLAAGRAEIVEFDDEDASIPIGSRMTGGHDHHRVRRNRKNSFANFVFETL